MSKLLLIINSIALAFSSIWMITSKFAFQPIVVTLGLISTLIVLIIKKEESDKNSIRIEGNLNKSHQENTNMKASRNNIEIIGDNNQVEQK